MPNLSDFDRLKPRLNLDLDNKALYQFWTCPTRERTYLQYLKACTKACARIADKYPDEDIHLYTHSTGGTVAIDPLFHFLDLYSERIKRITLLAPAIFVFFPNGRIPIHTTMTNEIFHFTQVLEIIPFQLPKSAFVPDYLFPGSTESTWDSPLTLSIAEVRTFLSAYANIHANYRFSIWDDFDVNVVLATEDYLVNNDRVKEWLPATIDVRYVEGHHEMPLTDDAL